MVNQKIIIDCEHINSKGFGVLLNGINKTLEQLEDIGLYVQTEIETKRMDKK